MVPEITTVGDLILKFVNTVFTSKDSILKQKRDKRDRIANYFESISETLSVAAKEFESGNRPWAHYQQIFYLLQGFHDVVKNIFEDEKRQKLFEELQIALHNDFQLLGDTRERIIVDAITVRPLYYSYERNNKENPVKKLSQEELQTIISEEIRKVKEVSGLFKGIAIELKAL